MVETIVGAPPPPGRDGDELGCLTMTLPTAQLGAACDMLGHPERAHSFNVQGSSSWVLQVGGWWVGVGGWAVGG